MTRTFKTEAIILKKRNLLNKDVVITFFSQELGKISVFAKGIKKITSRRLPNTQTGNLINAVIYKKDDRFYLQETNLISAFSQIKNNSKKIDYLYQFFFILERLLPENQKEEAVYKLVKRFMIELSKDGFDMKKLTAYFNDLLFDLGYLKEKKPLEEIRFLIEEIINEKIPSLII